MKSFLRCTAFALLALATINPTMPAHAQDAVAEHDVFGPPSPQVVELVGSPEPGKALVVFFREKKFRGAGVRYKVREDGVELGKLSSGRWFALQVDPGEHTYVVHSEARDITTLEFEAGQTYFILGTVTIGFLAGRPNLTPSDAATFESMMAKLKPAKPL